MEERTHVAVLASPGMGHVIPMVEFAKLLTLRHGIHVTCIVPSTGPPSKAMEAILESLPDGIDHIFLPPPSLEDIEGKPPAVQIIHTATRSLPSLREVLKSLTASTPVSALVADPFWSQQGLQVAKEFNMSPFLFFPSNATALALTFHLPKLEETISCEYRDLTDPVEIPGCIPIHVRDLPNELQDREGEIYKFLLQMPQWIGFAEGIALNTFTELEGRVIRALKEQEARNLPIYPIGPIIQAGSSADHLDRSECLRWLDNQPSGSVLLVAFGSGGVLSYDQLNELALGLELSGQRFLWVVRPPNDESANAAYLKDQSNDNSLAFLPEGFAERTKDQGLLVPSWAPQLQVLSHCSTGGFLTHCGWNSTLESIVHGVPLIVWPLHAEQRMNAVFLAEDLKVALRPKTNTEGLVVREEIASVINSLMIGEEGKQVNSRMKALKIAAEKALDTDGSSTKALSEFASRLASETKPV